MVFVKKCTAASSTNTAGRSELQHRRNNGDGTVDREVWRQSWPPLPECHDDDDAGCEEHARHVVLCRGRHPFFFCNAHVVLPSVVAVGQLCWSFTGVRG